MYNMYSRPCKFGPSCRYLKNGTCWYFHPDWHQDFTEENSFGNYFTLSNLNLYRSTNSELERQRKLKSEREKKEREEEAQRERERERQKKLREERMRREREEEEEEQRQRKLMRYMQMIRQRRQERQREQLNYLILLSMKQKEKQKKQAASLKIEQGEKNIKINGKQVQSLKLTTSKLGSSKKWFFEHSNHYNYFEECEHDACPICLAKFEKQDPISSLLCHHAFHSECIEKWLQKSENCPMCREAFNKHQQFKQMKGYQKPVNQKNPLLQYRQILGRVPRISQ